MRRWPLSRFCRILGVALPLILFVPAALGEEPSTFDELRPHADLPAGRTDEASAIIDNYFAAYWKGEKVAPQPRVNDATFLRRASLAVLGVPAEAEEVRAFLADHSRNKRRAKVDEMLVRSRYADYWAFRLRHWLFDLREVPGQGVNSKSFYHYAHEAMAENRSWARIADDMLDSQGSIAYDGNANFGVYFSGAPNEMADGAARLFLGAKISCAHCHDDPFHELWTRKSYWSFAAFFARINMKESGDGEPGFDQRYPDPGRSEASIASLPGGDFAIDGEDGEKRAIVDENEGEAYLGGWSKSDDGKSDDGKSNDKQPLPPTPLGSEPLKDVDNSAKTRRQQLVEWVTRKDNPYFARAAVNRMFLELTGRGFVATFDGFNPGEPVQHEKLLDRLAREFASRDFDLKWLIRTIVDSRVFQLPPPVAEQVTGDKHWQWAVVRPLNGDQWHDSVLRVTGREARIWADAAGAEEAFDRARDERLIARRKALEKARKVLVDAGAARRAELLPAAESVPAPDSPPAELKKEDQQRIDKFCKRYRDMGHSLRQSREQARIKLGPTGSALMQMNGKLVAESLRETDSPKQIAELPTPEARLDAVFIQVLGRLPRRDERTRLADAVAQPRQEPIVDLMWTLMQSSEFLTF